MSRFSLPSYFLFVSAIVRATDVGQGRREGDNVISRGKLVIEVSYFGWHIHSETHDLCDDTNCSVAIGDFLVRHSQVLPGYTPHNSYSLKMKMVDGHKKELTCIKFSFEIGFGSSLAADI
ncbi:hypothetical protein N665_0674s0012 [Sinapis alba]|nr:hypothetical protein N665_0674s0012 [Sinapis alba]